MPHRARRRRLGRIPRRTCRPRQAAVITVTGRRTRKGVPTPNGHGVVRAGCRVACLMSLRVRVRGRGLVVLLRLDPRVIVFRGRCREFQASPQFGPPVCGRRGGGSCYGPACTDASRFVEGATKAAMDGGGTALSWESAWTTRWTRKNEI
jgi:hypothetical protein